MKKKILQIGGVLVMVGLLGVVAVRNGWLPIGMAQAVGDLTIDWGVTTGGPIFEVTDAVPGETHERDVEVTNNAPLERKVGVRNEITEMGGLENVLAVVIKADGTPVYGEGSPTGPKTMNQFMTESASPNAIELVKLDPGENVTLTFALTLFDSLGDEEGQGLSLKFDVTIGIVGDSTLVPEECAEMDFDEVIFGTAGSDSIKGTPGNDLIFGLEGSDSIKGRGGNDCLVGGLGSDSLRGEDGDDLLFGGQGSDSLYGGKGDDYIIGGEGSDGLRGDDGNDYLNGEEADDGLRGGKGDDMLIGGPGTDSARGNDGIDTCDAESETTCES